MPTFDLRLQLLNLDRDTFHEEKVHKWSSVYQHQYSLAWMLNYFSSHGLFFFPQKMTGDATQHVKFNLSIYSSL